MSDIEQIDVNAELSKERTRESLDRTLNAWIRTAVSLIGFGFAIAKTYEFMEAGYGAQTGRVLDGLHAPLWFGAAFILLGLAGVVGAIMQYDRVIAKVKSGTFVFEETRPLPKFVAIALLIIGVFGLLVISLSILQPK
jgi:putative membrane protein